MFEKLSKYCDLNDYTLIDPYNFYRNTDNNMKLVKADKSATIDKITTRKIQNILHMLEVQLYTTNINNNFLLLFFSQREHFKDHRSRLRNSVCACVCVLHLGLAKPNSNTRVTKTIQFKLCLDIYSVESNSCLLAL